MPKPKPKQEEQDGKGKKFLLGTKGMTGNKNLPFVPKPPVQKPVAMLPPNAPAVGVPKNAKPTNRKKWCLKNTQVLRAFVERWVGDGTSKVLLPGREEGARRVDRYTVVKILDQKVSEAWSAVSFETVAFELTDEIKRTRNWVTTRVTGWILNDHLDDFVSGYPTAEVVIPHATPNSTDAQQYMTLEIDDEERKFKHVIRHNMCGELCVAYVAKKDIDSVLADWKAKPRSFFKSILGMGKDSTTGPVILKEILDIYFPPPNSVEPYIGASPATPLAAPGAAHRASDAFQQKLRTHDFITLLRINTTTGVLTRGERNHWVVVTRTMRNGLRVELYNPFPNRRQAYSFGEFNASVGSNPQSGWWVKRKGTRTEKPFIQPQFGVAADNPTSRTDDAEQYIFIEGSAKKKNNLCGQFSTAFIIGSSMGTSLENWKNRQKTRPAGLWELANMLDAYGFNNEAGKRSFSMDTVLRYWKKIQPNLYASTVGGEVDEGTDLGDLTSILRAYGYQSKDFSERRPGNSTEQFLTSPSREARILKDYFVLVGVNISGSTGRLMDKINRGVAHWVVIDSIEPDGIPYGGGGGWVGLYNPFMNCWEEYSLGEFARAFNGGTLWVKREITPIFAPETPRPPKPRIKPGKEIKPGKAGKGQGKNKPPAFGLPEILSLFERLMKQPGALRGKVIQKLANMFGMNRAEITKLVGAEGGSGKPDKGVEELLCRHLGVESVPAAITRWVQEKTGGNDTHAIQLADTLRRFGILVVRGRKSSLINLDTFDVGERASSAAGNPPTGKLNEKDRRALLLRGGGQITFEASRLAAKPFASAVVRELKATLAKIDEERSKNKLISRAKPKHGIKPQDKYLKWIKKLEAANPGRLYRVRIWGDPVMAQLGFDVNDPNVAEDAVKGVGHFQAVGLYNNFNNEFGAISNHIDIQRDDINHLIEMQFEDEFNGKLITRKQKMNWLCAHRGNIFMYDDASDKWETASQIRWGTIALGGNLVQIERFEEIETKLPGEKKKRVHRMGRLVGFRKSDWARPLDELLAAGLVHRCFCIYKKNGFGDVPNKGIVFSPLFSPKDWGFNGNKKLDALYIPEVYLELKPKK